MSEKGNPSEESLRLLLDRSPVVVYRYRLVPDRAFEYVNATAERLSGYTPDEFYADPEIGERLTHPDDRSVLLELLRAGWQSGPHVSRWIRKDGGQIWVEQTTVSVHDEHGVLVALEGMVRQIDDPTTGPLASIRTVGGIRIELVERRAYVDGREVDLTPAEFKLLVLLTDEPGRVVSRDGMMRSLWRSSHTGDGHTCEAHISNLRKKIERDPRHPARVITVRGDGYRFAVD